MTQSANNTGSSRGTLWQVGKRINAYVPGMSRYLAIQITVSITSGCLIIAQGYLLTQSIARVFIERQAPEQLYTLLDLLLIVIAGRMVLPWRNEILSGRIAARAKALLRELLLRHLFHISSSSLKDEQSGELAHVLSTGIEALDAYFTQVLPQLCATMIIPLLVLTAVALTDLTSALILLFTLPLLPAFMILIGKQSERSMQQRWQEMGQMSAHFLEAVQGSATLQLFGQSRAQRLVVRRASERFGRLSMQVLRIAFLSALAMEMGATLSMAVVAVEIGIRLLSGQMSFALAFLVLILTPEFFQPLRALGPQFHAAMESATGARRIFTLLDGLLAVSIEPREQATKMDKKIQTLQCERLAYTYPAEDGERSAAIADLSLRVERGQIVAITGASGAGKSTLGQLLLRFIEPRQGEIYLNGIPSSRIPLKEWRELISWQPQHPYLFNMSVAENIAIGDPSASRAEIMEVARQVGIHEMIQALPNGYETIIGERGARLSGGQIQRLSLARALLKKAPVLLLDEPTSALDMEAEAQVLQTLESLRSTQITLMITHRPQAIRQADLVLIMDKGRVVACGTPRELQQQSPFYRALLQGADYGREIAV